MDNRTPKTLKKLKNFSRNKFQTESQTQNNHSIQCDMLQILALVQHYYNITTERIK